MACGRRGRRRRFGGWAKKALRLMKLEWEREFLG
ncbi:hypothetical protein CCACVL1_13695 [Corchorus capsularis]|uniref:Uncharacterized protein n=1 Tax=Corchorus capsularis TaxID=210143 RepID=A0A1R3I9Y3_COCAP|nr:hypothetical protein CCACVL1_13695 [Corchorus capsularis]